MLTHFDLNQGSKEPIKKMILLNYKQFVKENPQMNKRKIVLEIDKLNEKLSVAREKLLSNIIDDEDYLELKKKYKEKIEQLEVQLAKSNMSNTNGQNVQYKLNKALNLIENISEVYIHGDVEKRRTLIGSIFPEKLEFDGIRYRTTRMNSVVDYIFQINNELLKNKNRKNDLKNHFSCLVPNTDQISKYFLEDLERLITLY